MAASQELRVGDRAPDFTLPSATGEMVSLANYRGRADVVLFFYPKDETAVCTKEACSFRDSYQAFQEAGAEVIGISSDSAASHQRFAERNHLPFLLLSDADGQVRARYGVKKTLGLIPGRTTFLIDREGIIRSLFSSQFQAARHVSETLGVLQRLHAKRPAP
ncbi:peroxiredoxin Q/BCP [Singulisphaera sp. GP187]|uniref:peroxiredoxin n=1 Tax=Singulisphaera sp. GP187 TaxID=1882752 RepID=UPI000928C5E4|nr:peroxiredoxin [Singulisphaera sp. GP187]SIN71530.1 peroxiredoxin Q/BCP [Singulisphaera sp. GP187]